MYPSLPNGHEMSLEEPLARHSWKNFQPYTLTVSLLSLIWMVTDDMMMMMTTITTTLTTTTIDIITTTATMTITTEQQQQQQQQHVQNKTKQIKQNKQTGAVAVAPHTCVFGRQHAYIYIYIYILVSQLVVHLFPFSESAGCPPPSQLVVHLPFGTVEIVVWSKISRDHCGLSFPEIIG